MSEQRREPNTMLVDALLEALDESGLRELASRLRPYLGDEAGRLLDGREAAALLGLHPDTLIRMARDHRIWAVKVGREWRFRADRLEILPADGSSPLPRPPARPRRVLPAVRASVSAIRGSA